MSDVRSVTIPQLRELVSDPSELAKGTEIADRGGLAHLARHGNKLFADAAGSGASPYKTQIAFGDDKVTGRCSCMAARSRPFCKHAAALLVSWARTPEAFVVAEAPPATPGGGAKRAGVKAAKVDPIESKKKGVDQALTVLTELWQTGVLAIASDRADQVADLATSLRDLGLRRLSVRMLELGALLRLAAKRDGSFPAGEYAALVADMWLTVRKLEKHLAGEPLAQEHVEELIGRTWTKKDRKPIAGLDLVEYAFSASITADGFVLRESRLFDLRSGGHFSEKQILPAMIAKRTPPKASYAERVLRDTSASVFPSFAPQRLDIEAKADVVSLDPAALALALEKALPSVSAALAALAERRRDVFAPPWVPVLVRTDWVVASRGRVRLLDPEGGTLFLAGGRAQEDALMSALSGGTEAVAVFGDVALEGAMPCLWPLAVVGKKDGVLRLLPLAERETAEPPSAEAWVTEAKRAGVSTAATLLGEVRDDIASGFIEGVSGVTQRFVDPLASRLAELSLPKQADALRAVASAADPIDRLDGLVKLHQVLGIALTRLVGTAKVDPASLVRLPTMPSVAIPRPAVALGPELAVSKEARGEIHRYERAYHVGVHYAAADPETLVREVDTFWGDGFAAPFVVRAATQHPDLAIASARAMLGAHDPGRLYRARSRLAKLTAIAILSASTRSDARAFLASLAEDRIDPTLAAHVRRALKGPLLSDADLAARSTAVLAASVKEDRVLAIEALASHAAREAIPRIRTALSDRASQVRRAAAYALAQLGDVESLDTFVSWLEGADHERAKIGAHAIGILGDVRGAGAILGALGRGFSPVVVREALTLLGPWVLGPLLDLTEAQPELAKRASVSSVVKTFERETTVASVVAWIDAHPDLLTRVARARLTLQACSARKDISDDVAGWIRQARPELLEGDDPSQKALKKKTAPPKQKAAKEGV